MFWFLNSVKGWREGKVLISDLLWMKSFPSHISWLVFFLLYVLLVCFIPPIFLKLFLLSPKSLQRKNKSYRDMVDGLKPLRPSIGRGRWLGDRLYTLWCWEMRVGSHHPDAHFQMSSYQPHYISGLNEQVEICGISLSSQMCYMYYPTPNLGGNWDYEQDEGDSSILSPNITTLLLMYSQCLVLQRCVPLSWTLQVSPGRKSHMPRFVSVRDSDATANCS